VTTISISIKKELLEDVGKLRGLVPRSTYICHLLRHCVENIGKHQQVKARGEERNDFE